MYRRIELYALIISYGHPISVRLIRCTHWPPWFALDFAIGVGDNQM